MIFFEIPKYVLLNIIQEFFCIDDIAKIEIALGNARGVKVLHNYLQSSLIHVCGKVGRPLPISVAWWASKRQLIINEFSVLCSIQHWKKMSDHQKTECYSSLSKVTALLINCEGETQTDIKSWFTRLYQYLMGTTNKQLLCNTLMLMIQSDKLTTLEITDVSYCIDDALTHLAKRLHHLRELKLCGFKKLSALTVNSLVRNNLSLQKVAFRNNSTLWGRVMIENVLSEHIPHSLQELELTFTSYEAHYAAGALQTLFSKCAPSLTTLSTNTWDALINAHQFPSLTSLSIEYTMENYVLYYSVPSWHSPTYLLHITIDVSATTDITVYYIVKSHPQLLTLRLISSDFVTVVAVQDTLKYCRRLNHLGLINCSLVGSDSIYNIANKRPHSLTSLDLRGLQEISTECVLHLLNMCSHLKELNVRGCNKLEGAQLDDYCADNSQFTCNILY